MLIKCLVFSVLSGRSARVKYEVVLVAGVDVFGKNSQLSPMIELFIISTASFGTEKHENRRTD